MTHFLRKIIPLLLLLCARLLLCAQSNEGTNFWFGFMEHKNVGENTMVVMITSKYNASGVVRIPLQNWQQTYTVAANAVTIIKMPASAENVGSEALASKGIQVTSDVPVSVYIHQYHAMRSEATLVLPETAVGQEYYVLTYSGYQDNTTNPSEFLLVGMEDSTTVTVTVSDETKGSKAAGTTFNVLINAGQTYEIQTKYGAGDLTASYVKGNKKFNVEAGCTWTQVPKGCFYRDNLLEQMYPVSTWGKRFASAPFAHMPYDVFRIMASEDNTTVTVEGQTTIQYNLNKGKYVEYQSTTPTIITGTKPIAVAQYLIGSGCSGYYIGDPSMIMLNSVEQIRDTVTLYNSTFEAIDENYIELISKTTDIPSTLFDGQPLPGFSNATIAPIGAAGEYSYAIVPVQAGAHTIISQGCGVIANAYGYGNVESYAYGGGANFKSINATSFIPEGGCLNDTLFFVTEFKAPRHTFEWDLGDGTKTTDAVFSHVYTALGTYKVTLYLTDNCLNIKDTLTRDLLVTLRQAAAVAGNPELCQGQEIWLGAQDLPGAKYRWTGPHDYSSKLQNPIIKNAQPYNAGIYTVIGIISGCATFPAEAEVTVHTNPTPYLGRDTVVCPDESRPLLTLFPGQYEQYHWSTHAAGPYYEVQDSGLYWVQVQDEHGCLGTDTIQVRAICPSKFYVPNVFSPNDDGHNDYFTVFGKDLLSLRLSVYDRWGSLLFQSNSLDARWDGTFRGKALDPGVYVWVAEIGAYNRDGTTYTTTQYGSVTLVR